MSKLVFDFYKKAIDSSLGDSPEGTSLELVDSDASIELLERTLQQTSKPEIKFVVKDRTNVPIFTKFYNLLIEKLAHQEAQIDVICGPEFFNSTFAGEIKVSQNERLNISFYLTWTGTRKAHKYFGEASPWFDSIERTQALLTAVQSVRVILKMALDVFSFESAQADLERVLELNRKFKNTFRNPAIYLDFEASLHPEWRSLKCVTDEEVGKIAKLRDFVSQNLWSNAEGNIGFHDEHVQQLTDIIKWTGDVSEHDKIKAQTAFNTEIEDAESRTKFVFSDMFPDLSALYSHCLQFDPNINDKNLQKSKKLLDSVSPSFCLAKWTTSTLHLESGTTHSCHHPAVHQIPKHELIGNPSALHNTYYKIDQRKKMMKGERPSECDYCWNIEDLSHGEVSDRFIKSAAPYSIEEFKKITENPFSPKQIPRYVEISFSNKCQFKCSYCSSDYSSTWMDEIEKFGKYSTDSGTPTKKIYTEEENPYVKAFWDWWPELKTNLHTLRVTGGEPLLSPSTFKLMEALNQEPNRKLSLSINSNLGAPAVLIDKFVKLAVETEKNKAVKKLDVYTSIDAWGPRAEYIRNGLKHDYFWDNVEKLLGSTQEMRVYIMCTFNAMSLTSFLPLLKKVREINIKYRNRQRVFPLDIDFAYLRYPEYQSVKVLPSRYQSYIEEIIQHLEQNQWLKTEEKIGFLDYHVLKMKRILEWMRQDWPPETLFSQRVRFYEFFKEHDRRRNTNFLETFPEMEDFWTGCKQLYEIKNR